MSDLIEKLYFLILNTTFVLLKESFEVKKGNVNIHDIYTMYMKNRLIWIGWMVNVL